MRVLTTSTAVKDRHRESVSNVPKKIVVGIFDIYLSQSLKERKNPKLLDTTTLVIDPSAGPGIYLYCSTCSLG